MSGLKGLTQYSYLKPFSCKVYIDVSRGRISVSTHSSRTLRSMTLRKNVTKKTAWIVNQESRNINSGMPFEQAVLVCYK